MSVKLVRLTTGEEILCTITNSSSDQYKRLVEPTYIMPQGEGKIALAPFMPYAKTEEFVDINKDCIMFIVEPVDELGNQYKEIHSKIMVPNNKLVKNIVQ